jgi:tungstate transport system permease protein
VLEVVLLSLRVSGAAVLLGVLLGLPAGIALGVLRFRGRGLLVALYTPASRCRRWWSGCSSTWHCRASGPLGRLELLFTPTAMIIAQAILAAPYIAGISLAAVQAVPAEVRLQAMALGASPLRALLTHLREARLGIVAAIVAGFGAVISEVGAVMLVGGNIAGETRVMTTAIVLETRRGNFATAMALGLILLLLAFMP